MIRGVIRGVLFDKDGTLFDFEQTWNRWAFGMLMDLAEGDRGKAATLGAAIGFDLARAQFEPDSMAIAGTQGQTAEALSAACPKHSPTALLDAMNEAAANTPQVEVVPLRPLLSGLRAAGYALGVATNDAQAPARAHLDQAGIADMFDFVAGFDSGFGGKPGPGMCRAFLEHTGLAPREAVMVGDSRADIEAGRAAGMQCVAVTPALGGADALAAIADAMLPDISHLPTWLLSQNSH
ncbi:MAG: HAD family hydrolase [Pseudomonadota bacterium]